MNEILILLIDKINEKLNETLTKIPLILTEIFLGRPETSIALPRNCMAKKPLQRGGETLFLTLPLLDVPAMKSHKGAEITKLIACKTFCHGISGHFVRRDILEDDAAVFNAFPNEVMLNFDVLCACMIFRVLGESDRALIVSVDDVRVGDRDSDLLDDVLDPDGFLRRLS